jgi:HEAT repeat protein
VAGPDQHETDGRVDDAPTSGAPPVGRHVHPDPAPDVEVSTRRRQAILAGHGGDARLARDLLTDPAAPVRAAALGALDRIARSGGADGLTTDELAIGLADPEPAVRRRALEALAGPDRAEVGRSDTPDSDQDETNLGEASGLASRLTELLLACLEDADHSVLEVACWAAGELPEVAETTVDALTAVAGPEPGGHEDALCREAAVAALGALGHERGRAAILGGLGDRPAVRRRAVLALAAFEGDDVEAALERALEDRDWQVRQAAEDLLGPGTTGDRL